MLFTEILKNNYQDSINLMLLTNKINELDGVGSSQVMMGTDANKDILDNTGLLTDEAKSASGNDIMVVVDSDQEAVLDTVLSTIDSYLSDLSSQKASGGAADKAVTNWDEALEAMPDANLALFSIPGEYGAPEMMRALNSGLNVFSFTDNIALEDEIKLKELAKEKGLLMMGPDCGTGIISSVPLAFTNVVAPGNIGVVAASGTGIQEVTTIIDRLGGGVVHAIGTGGRDLNEKVGAITVKDSILGLESHDATDVICVISKPPAKAVRDEVVQLLQSISKPVVAIFMGEKPTDHVGNVYFAHTLEEAARISVDLANDKEVAKNYLEPLRHEVPATLAEDKVVIGLYSGGTLGNEAATLITETLAVGDLIKEDGFLLRANGYDVIDLGDDMYTQGKPHPMIDPEMRIKKIKEYASHENTGVILLDVVLGYGAHSDMAGALLPTIEEELAKAKEAGRDLHFVATVVGTDKDPQNYRETVKRLEDAGVLVEDSNAKAVRLALALKGHNYEEVDKKVLPYEGEKVEVVAPSEAVLNLLTTKPKVINVGLQSFNESIQAFGGESVQFDWRPRAGGNKRMIKILDALEAYEDEIAEENQKVVDTMKNAQPFLIDVVTAHTVIPELADPNKKVILHAGPPLTWEQMTGPMKGSCIGAVLFEKWADNEVDAVKLLSSGEVEFMPCHHAHAVGPMGGITSASMAVMVVENRLDGTVAYCTMNEGIGKVLRFGAYSQEVVDRLGWMASVLGPTLSKAIKKSDDGININVIIAKAITMGDEFHQRNIAASLNFLKEVSPLILQTDVADSEKYDVIKFLADTDQFFLNIMMAAGKAIVDTARKNAKGTIVTTMSRNGVNFGIRTAENEDQWFEAPVNDPRGLYFTGFTAEDGNPDIGDSAIVETVGAGGMAMIAAPGVTRFVGAGGFQDAVDISNEMVAICETRNPNWSIPNWDFQGVVLGIDIRKVVATGITPIINTGIAHKEAGIGQVGAGTVRAPLGCFEKALEAYAESKGIAID